MLRSAAGKCGVADKCGDMTAVGTRRWGQASAFRQRIAARQYARVSRILGDPVPCGGPACRPSRGEAVHSNPVAACMLGGPLCLWNAPARCFPLPGQRGECAAGHQDGRGQRGGAALLRRGWGVRPGLAAGRDEAGVGEDGDNAADEPGLGDGSSGDEDEGPASLAFAAPAMPREVEEEEWRRRQEVGLGATTRVVLLGPVCGGYGRCAYWRTLQG